ncbi:RHS repeat domain-containing protein [Chitinimonas lacunae]|uniref:RHS repeat domain-containing protein n=1 Tax=Chitinimonas lacunae TaxID=1963018 RepID=A0ABV8MUG1_9NEIS
MMRSIQRTGLAVTLVWLLPSAAWAGGTCSTLGGPTIVGFEYISSECPASSDAPLRYQRVALQCLDGRLEPLGAPVELHLSPLQLASSEPAASNAEQGFINRLGTQAILIDRTFQGRFRLDDSGQANSTPVALSQAGRCAGTPGAGDPPSGDNPGCQSDACLEAVAERLPAVNPGWRGNLFHVDNDYRGGGATPLQFTRYYNSQPLVLPFDAAVLGSNAALVGLEFFYAGSPVNIPSIQYHAPLPTAEQRLARGELGNGWRGSLSRRVVPGVLDGRTVVALVRDDGKSYLYREPEAGQPFWRGDLPSIGRLESGPGTGWRFVSDAGEVELYDPQGRLVQVSLPDGQVQMPEYDASGRLQAIHNQGEGRLRFTYTAEGQLASMLDLNAQETRYEWQDGQLVRVLSPYRPPLGYRYAPTSPARLTELLERGQIVAFYRYDQEGRVREGGLKEQAPFHIDYSLGQNQPVLAGPAGVTHFVYRDHPLRRLLSSVRTDCVGSAGCQPEDAQFDYDEAGLLRSYQSGPRRSEYQHDPQSGLEVLRREFAPGIGMVQTETSWDHMLRRPHWRQTGTERTSYRHDFLGRLTDRELSVGGTVVRRWHIERDENGRPLAFSLNNFITRYAYTSSGELMRLDNPNRSLMWRRDQAGRIQAIEGMGFDPISLDRDALGRLRLYRQGNTLLSLDYDAEGRLSRAEGPRGSISYHYGWSGQLEEIRSPSGASLRYQYGGSPAGATVGETAFDPDGEIAAMLAQVRTAFDAQAEPVLPR